MARNLMNIQRGSDLPHLPQSFWLGTPEPWLWPHLLSSLYHCKQRGIHGGQEGRKAALSAELVLSLGTCWPNRHVANIVQRLREVKVSPEGGAKRKSLCSPWRKLQLFCEQDGKVICWLSVISGAPRSQHIPHGEIAPQYQVETRMEGKTEQDGTWGKSLHCTGL